MVTGVAALSPQAGPFKFFHEKYAGKHHDEVSCVLILLNLRCVFFHLIFLAFGLCLALSVTVSGLPRDMLVSNAASLRHWHSFWTHSLKAAIQHHIALVLCIAVLTSG